MTVDRHPYTTLAPKSVGYFAIAASLLVLAALGALCAQQLHHAGHIISGMNNRIVWGLPHVFAILLIVTASGILNPASFASVFAQQRYKLWSRLSVALAIALLIGGLAILVLDLGRPDRLVIALTHWNFDSIFAWNIFLYSGFVVIGALYLWMLMERRFNRFSSRIGHVAFAWRLVLTSGTGSIFGFLVARDALDAAIYAPLFIALSLVLGNAVFILTCVLLQRSFRQANQEVIDHAARLLMWFGLALGYFSIVLRLTNSYVEQHSASESFLLGSGLGWIFWIGHILLGVLIPIVCILLARPVVASMAAIAGAFVLIYVVVIGSQQLPQTLFPDKSITDSLFGDNGIAAYSPSIWELGLGLGGVAIAGLIALLAMRVLPLLPQVVSCDQ